MFGEVPGYNPETEGEEDDKNPRQGAETGVASSTATTSSEVSVKKDKAQRVDRADVATLDDFDEVSLSRPPSTRGANISLSINRRSPLVTTREKKRGSIGVTVGYKERSQEERVATLKSNIEGLLAKFNSTLVPRITQGDSFTRTQRYIVELQSPRSRNNRRAVPGEGKVFQGTAREILADLENHLKN